MRACPASVPVVAVTAWVVFCFAKPEDAAAFCKQFDGSAYCSSYSWRNKNPGPRSMEAVWGRGSRGDAAARAISNAGRLVAFLMIREQS